MGESEASDTIEEIVLRYSCGEPLSSIGGVLGISNPTIRKALVGRGVPIRGHGRSRPMAERFWRFVACGSEDICWPWFGGLFSSGYGNFSIDGKRGCNAHRAAFFLTQGFWPNVCRHKCDNRICVNPAHLEDGTIADNHRDMISRGRAVHAFGEDASRARLTEADVIRIRTERRFDVEWAREFGVSAGAVNAARRRVSWKHLP